MTNHEVLSRYFQQRYGFTLASPDELAARPPMTADDVFNQFITKTYLSN